MLYNLCKNYYYISISKCFIYVDKAGLALAHGGYNKNWTIFYSKNKTKKWQIYDFVVCEMIFFIFVFLLAVAVAPQLCA